MEIPDSVEVAGNDFYFMLASDWIYRTAESVKKIPWPDDYDVYVNDALIFPPRSSYSVSVRFKFFNNP